MSFSIGSYSSQAYSVAFQNITFGTVQTAQSLLTQFDSFSDAGGGHLPSMAEMMLAAPPGYLRGGIGQEIGYAAGFLDGLQASSMMDVSVGSRMMLGLSMFQSSLFTQSSFSINTSMSITGPIGPQGKDKFAVHESCRTGADTPSNLNNSPHVKLALYNILKDHHDSMPPEQLKKELEERYGIRADITTVKGDDGRDLKALKFENGDIMADGSGNGSFGMADYNLKGAVEDIQKQYGISPEDFDKNMKAAKDAGVNLGFMNDIGKTRIDIHQSYNFQYNAIASQFQAAMPYLPYQPFFPMQDVASIFAQAMMFSQYQ